LQQSKEEATCLKEKLSQKLPQPLKILAAAFKIYDMFDVKNIRFSTRHLGKSR